MDDLDRYIDRRKKKSPAFAKSFDAGYDEFRVGVMLREMREHAGITQQELADAIHTKKSVISRLENQASDVRLSTLRKVASALGKNLVIELAEVPPTARRRQKTA